MAETGPPDLPAPDEAELASALVHMKDGVVILGPDLHIRWVNRSLCRMLGYKPSEIVGENIVPFLHPDEVQFAFHAVAIASAEPSRQVPGQYRLLHHDGSWVAAELSASFSKAPHLGEGAAITVITVRPTSHRDVLTNGYVDLTRGAPIDSVLDEALDWYRERAQRYRMCLTYLDVHGDGEQWSFNGDALPHELRGLPPQLNDPSTPWGNVLSGNDHVVADLSTLPDPIAKAADAAGLRSVMVLGVDDPAGVPALLTFWIDADPTLFPQGYTVKTPALILIELALERRHYLARLEQAATTDPLTKLANRRVFFERLDSLPAPPPPEPPPSAPQLAVLYMDLDGFKQVNDRFGHAAGDHLLVTVAERLRASLRPDDLLARLGGDEFAAMCPGVSSTSEATVVADRLLAAVAEPVEFAGQVIVPSISIGIAIAEHGIPERSPLLTAADEAMYVAKRTGKGRWVLADG